MRSIRQTYYPVSPEDIFYENYKIHVFTELKDVIDTGTENGYLEKEYYRALYEERGSILTGLYDDFVGSEYASIYSYTDTAEFIKDYCEHYHKSVLYEEVKMPVYLQSAQYAIEQGDSGRIPKLSRFKRGVQRRN